MNAYVQKVDGSRKVPENYKKSPLPIVQKSEIILVDSKAKRSTIVTVEAGVSSVRVRPPETVACTSIRYNFAYTVNKHVGERAEVVAERFGHWEFTPGRGLSLETDADDIDEVNQVMGEALCALYKLAALVMAHSDPATRKVTLLPVNWTKGTASP